ncbi:hypothetical protein OG883_26840 [Streptomyces sp. NBC_01142]|uniref:NPCBM/NEW2 domain-containing protein n=1 Tax=Streptomyces sp. NBC_01142 TaxID=2975865 RepID=UPI00224E1EC9|nr:NPCBM/NEW2 domain-containing protein [Streptomyces sp. NBC_01142]MCX4823432.1 hypothetical protein [Streptomyces sp. NBC_01142]
MAALVSAITAVFGLILGFFGLPTFVNSPTARTVTKTVEATVTVTATPDPAAATPGPGSTSSAVPPPSASAAGPFSLVRDLIPFESAPYTDYVTGSQKVDGRSHPTTLNALCGKSTWQLDRDYKTLTTRFGVSDDAPSGRTFTFYIDVDGTRKKEMTKGPGDGVDTMNVDLDGAFRVSLGIDGCSYSEPGGRGVWIDPAITKAR